jgi:hypothetical protein
MILVWREDCLPWTRQNERRYFTLVGRPHLSESLYLVLSAATTSRLGISYEKTSICTSNEYVVDARDVTYCCNGGILRICHHW